MRPTRRTGRLAVVAGTLAVLVTLGGTTPLAQMTGAPAPGYRRDVGTPASTIPAPLREIGFDQKIDERLPLDVELKDGRILSGKVYGVDTLTDLAIIIVSYNGWPIGGPASKDKEEIIYAEANLADARRKRNWNEYNQVLRDRRTDVYGEMLGSEARPGWY